MPAPLYSFVFYISYAVVGIFPLLSFCVVASLPKGKVMYNTALDATMWFQYMPGVFYAMPLASLFAAQVIDNLPLLLLLLLLLLAFLPAGLPSMTWCAILWM